MRACARALAIVLLAGLVFAPSVEAFERAKVESDGTTPLYWRYRTVRLRTAYDTSADVPATSIQAALGRSIASWNDAALSCSDFRFVDDGEPSGLSTNLLGGEHDGENRIVWREDEWPADDPWTLAKTSWIYRPSTGEILDVDIDVNGVTKTWTDTTDPGFVVDDVENMLTHELGHVLGLAHTPLEAATMYEHAAPGDLDKRTLHEDDIAGLCHIYPEGRLTPGAPWPTTEPLRGTCSLSPGAHESAPWPVLALLSLLAGRRALRRGARGSRPGA